MKILLVNKFFYPKGGAEKVLIDTGKLLESRGHKVIFFSMHNEKNLSTEYSKYFVSNIGYEKMPLRTALFAAARMLYSIQARKKIEELIRAEKPDIAHLHNIYHQISPSILHSLKKFKVPSVMTLHDCKLCCAQYQMIANNSICEACRGNTYYHCFLKACIKGSRLTSLLNMIEMYLHHNILHIYDLIDCFISPSKFLKDEVEKMGFTGRKMVVLPNMLKVEDFNPSYGCKGNSIIYFGRLSKEKGLLTLIDAVKKINNINLNIAGEGPMRMTLEDKIKKEKITNVNLLGYKAQNELNIIIRNSLFAVCPSEWFENNPRSVIEAFALGKPVIGARIGGMAELITNGKTGLTFKAGDVADLRAKIEYLLTKPDKIEEMGRNARVFVEQELNAEKHYLKLMEIYGSAIEGQKI